MTTADVQHAIFAGNDIAMQWYALTHPTQPGMGGVVLQPLPGGGSSLQIGSSTMLVIGALVLVAAVVLLND